MKPARAAMLSMLLIIGSACAASGEEPRREAGAHAHGEGHLAIAIEGGRVEIELEAPASDIVGFEHAPANDAQRQAVGDARARLARIEAVVQLPPEAGCKLTSAEIALLAIGQGHDHGHDHGHEDKSASSAGEKAAPSEHSEARASYVLTCAEPGKLRAVTFEYFKSFPGAQKLEVTVVGPKGQSQFEATREKPVVELGGLT